MKASVVVVTHDSRPFIDACLQRLRAQAGLEAEIVVVDNGSMDGTPQHVLAQHPGVRVIVQPNLGFGAGCNRGAREATGDVLAFLNPDTQPAADWLARLVDELASGRIHTSQLVHLEKPGRVQTLGLELHYSGFATLRREGEVAPILGPPEAVPGFSGAAFAMMRSDFDRLGGFDEGFFLYLEDVDLAWRARRSGMTVWGIPASIAYHRRAGQVTPAKLAHLRRGRERLLRKHLPIGVRRRLAPALGFLRFAERLAGGPKPSPLAEPTRIEPLERRPDWLRLTLPVKAMPGVKGKAWAVLANPLVAVNALLWRR